LLNLYIGGGCVLKNKKDNRQAKAIGSQVNVKIWNELKIQAIREGRKTGQVLDDAIRLYLESKKGDILGIGFPLE
jgi:hypothetical protein